MREILIPLGVNLVAASIVYYLRGPAAGLIAAGAGVLLIVIGYFLLKKSQAGTTPTMTQNQTTNINIGGGVRELKPSWHQRKQWLEATDGGRVNIGKELPNLRPQDPENDESVHLDVLDAWSTRAEEKIPESNKALALLIPIRNQPKEVGSNIGIAANVRARLVWSVGNKEVCTAYPAAWVNEEANTVKIGAEAKRLIVALEFKGGSWRVPTNQRGYGDSRRQAMRLDTLPREDATMEVQLVREKTDTIETLAIFFYKWEWRERGPELTFTSAG